MIRPQLLTFFAILTPKTGALPEGRATTSQAATDENATQSPLVPPRPGRRVIVYMGNRPWFSSMYGVADASRTEYHVPSTEAKPSTTAVVSSSDAPSLSPKESGQTGVASGPASDKANKLSSATLLASETTSNEASTEAENDRSDLIGELDVSKHPPPPLPPFNGPKIEFRTTTVHHTSPPRNDDSAGFQQDRRSSDSEVSAAALVGANRRAALQESTAGRSSSAGLSAARQEELADRNLNSRYFTFGPGSATSGGGGSRSNNAFGTTGRDDSETSRDDDPASFNGGGDRFNQQRPTFGGAQDNRRPALPSLPPPPPPPPPPAPTASPPTASTFGTTRFHFSFPSEPAIFGNNSLANRGDFQFETSHGQDSSSAQRDGDGRSSFTSAEQRTTPPVRSQELRQFPTFSTSRAPASVTPPPPRQTASAERTFQTFANQRQAPVPNAPSSAGQTLRFNFRESNGQARTNPPPPPSRSLQTPVTNSFVTYFTNSDSRESQKSAPLTDTRDRQQTEPRLNFRSGSFQTTPPRPPPQRPTSTSIFQGPPSSQPPRAALRNNLEDNDRSREFSAPNSRGQVTFRPNVFPVDPPSNTFTSNQRTQNGFSSSARSQEDFTSNPRSQNSFSPANTAPRGPSTPRNQNSFSPANTVPRGPSTPRNQNSFSPANTLPRANFQTSQSPRSNFQTSRPLSNFQANQRSQNDFSSNSRQSNSFDGSARGQNSAQGNSRAQDVRFQSFGNSQSNFQSNGRPPFPGNQPSSQAPAQRPQSGFAVTQRPSDSFQGNQRDRNAFTTSPQQRPQNNFAGADQSPRDRVQTSQRLQEAPRGRPQNSFQNVSPPRPQAPAASPPAVRNPTPQNNGNANPQDNLEPFRNDFQIALRQRAFSATTASPVDTNDGGGRTTTTQNFQSPSQPGNGATKRKINRVVFIPGNFGVTPTRRPDPYRSKLPGLAGSDYPTYSEVPFTNFKCSEQSTSGMFADVEAGCQVFHSCDNNNRQKSFLCPNGTIFKQELFTCDWWYNVDCDSSSKYFHLNSEMYTTRRPKPRDSQDDVNGRSDSGRSRSF
ncbi:uncharacterized protein LOC125756240 [Rhipicephalus sanguineus]|uniref:uncharacterized protein LOC125756240 n=1 Tax=Rhipicephalus sanguineus TaxID=34632 RepID=UPI0020C4CA33|nr:uncharacterized protein LOC125756240 [Rhipicephalus sanguineus]